MAEAKQWQVVFVKAGQAATPKLLPTREAAVEAARLFAVHLGAKGWCRSSPSKGVALLFGPEGGGWCCFICAAVAAPVAAPKARKGRPAVAAPPSVGSPMDVN